MPRHLFFCLVLVCVSEPADAVAPAQLERYRSAMMPTEDEALELALNLQESLHAGDLVEANRYLDTGALVERVVTGVGVSPERIEAFVDGLIVTLQERAWFGAEVVDALELGGDYRLLRTFEADGQRRVLYRMLTTDGGLNYHEMVLERRGLAGPVRVVDVYVHLTAEKLSESYRRALVSEELERNETRRINELIRAREFREALEVYHRLPEELQNDKSMLIKRLMITQDLDDALYVDTIERLRAGYPDDPGLDLISLDAFVLGGEYGCALDVLDRLEARIGGDPYLNVQRAGVHLLRRDYPEAVRYAESALASDPFLEPGYWALASIALETREWPLLITALEGLEDNFALDFHALEDVPEYLEFVGSPEYDEWESANEN